MLDGNRLQLFLKKIRRYAYGLRLLLPGLRDHHRLERMVGPLGFWHELQNYQLNTLIAHGLQRHHTLLDFGCGPLQGGVAIINYLNKGGYTGLDISRRSLGAAYGQISKNSLQLKNPRLIHSDCLGELELGNATFDFIFASQVLYYFDARGIRKFFKIISKRLNGQLFIGDVLGPRHYENKYAEPGYCTHDIAILCKIAESIGLEMEDKGEISVYGYPSRLSMKSNRLIALRKPGSKVLANTAGRSCAKQHSLRSQRAEPFWSGPFR